MKKSPSVEKSRLSKLNLNKASNWQIVAHLKTFSKIFFESSEYQLPSQASGLGGDEDLTDKNIRVLFVYTHFS